MANLEKKYFVITGASKGIGKSFAFSLAKRGFNLLIIARSVTALKNLQSELISTYKISVELLSIDLAKPNATKEVYNWIEENNFQLTGLVNNAGYGLWGAFSKLTLTEQLEMCQLNMNTVIELCHLLIPLLQKEKQAYILNVSSTAAYQALPTLAVYGATKSFILSFTRALRFELKNTPISVSCLSPGPVDTGFAHRAGLDPFSKLAKKFNMNSDDVAEIAINGLFKKKSEIIPGFNNLLGVYANNFLPKAFIEKTIAGFYKL